MRPHSILTTWVLPWALSCCPELLRSSRDTQTPQLRTASSAGCRSP